MADLVEFGLDEEELTKKARQLIKNLKWYEKNIDSFREKYMNKYIAIYNKKIVDFDKDLIILKNKVKERNLDLDYVLFKYVYPKNVILIL